MEFWNSAEILGKINTYLQIFLVGFGIATGLVGAASFFVGHRKTSLDALHEERFLTKRRVRYMRLSLMREPICVLSELCTAFSKDTTK